MYTRWDRKKHELKPGQTIDLLTAHVFYVSKSMVSKQQEEPYLSQGIVSMVESFHPPPRSLHLALYRPLPVVVIFLVWLVHRLVFLLLFSKPCSLTAKALSFKICRNA